MRSLGCPSLSQAVDAAVDAVARGEAEAVAVGSSGDALRSALLRRIVLSGGSANIAGLPERLAHELEALRRQQPGSSARADAEAAPPPSPARRSSSQATP